ncbi:hypothetical protein [Leptospira alexanderi]|uniref:hypothetical protein n=1 Tax=Leptospira alexanderi TaxID=100053 RepID=UPI00111563EE|nr:hypothetical protein [Leptospira alexanderi]
MNKAQSLQHIELELYEILESVPSSVQSNIKAAIENISRAKSRMVELYANELNESITINIEFLTNKVKGEYSNITSFKCKNLIFYPTSIESNTTGIASFTILDNKGQDFFDYWDKPGRRHGEFAIFNYSEGDKFVRFKFQITSLNTVFNQVSGLYIELSKDSSEDDLKYSEFPLF